MSLSLWVVPREGNPFTKTMQELINDTVPRQFLSEKDYKIFTPHVTITSEIDENSFGGKSAQEWLDSIQLPEFKAEFDEAIVELDTLEAEDEYFRKMNIALKDNANLRKLAAVCRGAGVSGGEEKAQAWAQNEYRPHFSLLYADTPVREVQAKIALIEMKIGFAIGDLFACCGGTLCMGGHLVLVDTSKPIEEWKPVARRETPWLMWRATKNLI